MHFPPVTLSDGSSAHSHERALPGAFRRDSAETTADPLGDSGNRTRVVWSRGPSPDGSAGNHRFLIAVCTLAMFVFQYTYRRSYRRNLPILLRFIFPIFDVHVPLPHSDFLLQSMQAYKLSVTSRSRQWNLMPVCVTPCLTA